jgi:hypothetical protein
MKSVLAEDCGDYGDLVASEPADVSEDSLGLTLFRNPLGLITVFVFSAIFYSTMAYAIWRIIR